MPEPQITAFQSGDVLAQALAEQVAGVLATATDRDGAATLAVSGGSTPGAFFTALSRHRLAWEKVTVTLEDERFVPPTHLRSNHRLVATHLLRHEAACAAFLPLFADDHTPEDAARLAAGRLDRVKQPLDVVVLGMGTDGHTASWFPGSPELAALTDPIAARSVMAATAPGAEEPRLSLTLPVIANAGLCVLHIEGNDKKRVLEEALQPGPVDQLPVRAILTTTAKPLQIYWAP